MQIRTKQYLIVIIFSVLSIFVYKHGVNIDHGTLNVSANVSNFKYNVGRNEFECATNQCSQLLKPSSYTLQVSKDGFLTYQKDIKLEQQQVLNETVDLEPVPQVVEIKDQDFVADTYQDQGFLWSYNGSKPTKLLALDKSRVLSSFSYNKKSNSAIVIYDQKDMYSYNLNESQSLKLNLPKDFQPKLVKYFRGRSLLVSDTSENVFQANINNTRLELSPVTQLAGVNHFLPVRNGYLIILPANLNQSNFNLSDVVTSGIDTGVGAVTSQAIKSEYEKVDRALFYYSNQSKKLTSVLDIESIKVKNTQLVNSWAGKNSTPILRYSNSIYEIQL